MFKKIKENPYYIKFKEMRADPKLKPITSLILWFIFIVIVVIFIKSSYSNEPVQKENINSISNYEFTYKNNNLTIFGNSYDGKMEFILNGNRYYYDLENVYLISNKEVTFVSNFDLNVLKITPKFIENLTANLSYSLNGEAKVYTVPLYRFLNLYEVDVEVDLSIANQYNILVSVYDDMYEIDLTNYYNFRGLNNDGILTIDLYESNIGDFTKYYDKLVGGVK